MAYTQDHQKTVSVIIPAYNEARTIADVVRVAVHHPEVLEVIVVDDGSHDSTPEIARAAGAHILQNKINLGKAGAMKRGVAAAASDIICFLNADLRGFTSDMLTEIITPVLTGKSDMFVAIRGRGLYWLNAFFRFMPIVGGERCLHRAIWDDVPAFCKKNFQIEIALNYITKVAGTP